MNLKPCPFCGRNPEAVGRSGPHMNYNYWVSCSNVLCDAIVGSNNVYTEAEAIAAWNRRIDTSPEPVDKVEDCGHDG